jgi:hypothetical protein
VALLQTVCAWSKELQQSCARPASKERKRNFVAFLEGDRGAWAHFRNQCRFVANRHGENFDALVVSA